MALPAPISSEEYLAAERKAEIRHEFVNGVVYAMAGGSLFHSEIIANLISGLGQLLAGSGCRPLGSDLRVKVSATGMYTYPDVTVVCGKAILEDNHQDTLLNPVAIFEVLSPSTESYDRGAKFAHYRRVETLRTYVVITQDSAIVERHDRQDDGHWVLTECVGITSALELPTLGVSIPLAKIYANVDLEEGPITRQPKLKS